jgi:hypothetical protein
MKPTRLPVLLGAVVVAALLGYLLCATVYAGLPPLPAFAPAPILLVALVEAGLALIVRDRVHGARPSGRPMHALQIARAAVLAKASSLGGALLFGLYGGFFVWTFVRRGELAAANADAKVAGLSAAAALALVVAALVLERFCRTPDNPEDERDPAARR